jgi:carbon starvation protein
MSLLAIVLASGACLLVAYLLYGRLLARLLRLDDRAVTPAVSMRDGIDYEPIAPKLLLSQHLSAIAAAGPIVGPILAGLMFGWLPALLWILLGAIFVGGVHDMTALVASVRHKGRSIAEVVSEHMTRRSYVLFLLFVWIALVYIIVAFTDIVAKSFVSAYEIALPDGGTHAVPAGAIATSSLLYLALPVAMGLLLRFTKIGVGAATAIFLPLVGVAIWLGPRLPLDLAALLSLSPAAAHRAWDVILLGYCFVASLVPVWTLLQPRGHLGGWFLVAALAAGVVGILFGGFEIEYDTFTGWTHVSGAGAASPLAPILFITIACGACSGFHCLIASGTTSKQLRRESDAKAIGYGAMLLEAMVAVLSLSCVMIVAKGSAGASAGNPDFLYAQGLSRFMSVAGLPVSVGLLFGLLAFTTFVYDTLDVCTRLGRFIVQELTGLHNAAGRWLGTAVTAAVPLVFVMRQVVDAKGDPVPAWRVFWALFGASNQLLAALALVAATVWLWRTYRARWVWIVAGVPAAFMYVMSTWALLRFIASGFAPFARSRDLADLPANPVAWVAIVLVALAAILLVEAVAAFMKPRGPARPEALAAAT